MKNATTCGIAEASKKAERTEITDEEEKTLWEKGLLGGLTAESLLHTIYFYNGKLFGLRASEHRLLRLSNITISSNYIIFDETCSKTFHGGLKDLGKKPRYLRHKCHDIGDEKHLPCLVSLYSLYFDKVRAHSKSNDSFYLKPHRNGKLEYENSALGIGSLNKILPEKLCKKAGLPRKTAHCLRVTQATKLFQNKIEEKLTRQRTGHRSDALFAYEKPSLEQLDNVCRALGPSNDSRKNSEAEQTFKEGSISEFSSELAIESLYDGLFDVSDDILSTIPMPDIATNEDEGSKTSAHCLSNPIFNNCTVNFVVNK